MSINTMLGYVWTIPAMVQLIEILPLTPLRISPDFSRPTSKLSGRVKPCKF